MQPNITSGSASTRSGSQFTNAINRQTFLSNDAAIGNFAITTNYAEPMGTTTYLSASNIL